MPLTTNTSPYWDDYKDDSQYYRILFRPGYAVQARELTQLQTSLQKQIERHGKHMFTHGSRVLDGQVAYNKCDYIKLSDYEGNISTGNEIDVWNAYSNTALVGIKIGLDNTTAGDYIVDADGRVSSPDGRRPVARVVLAEPRTDNGDPDTLLLRYESEYKFAANDYITKFGDPYLPDSTTVKWPSFSAVVNNTVSSSGAEVGGASYAAIEQGVYFITTSTGGYFAHTPKQRIILDKYSDSPTYKIGLKINETIVTESIDTSLYDNSQGSSATFAPGAHRLKVALDLSKAPESDGISINPASAQDFVELLRIENGQRAYGTNSNQDPIYSILGEALAKRTFDESGNYIVDDFSCQVEDGPGDSIKVTVQPASGKTSAKAYIRGRQYEQAGSWVEYIQRARKTAVAQDLTTPLNHGAYILVTDLQSQGIKLSPGDVPAWDLHTCNTYQVNTNTTGSGGTAAQVLNEKELAYKSTRAGQFRIRDVQYVGANTHAIYVTDFEGSPALTGNFNVLTTPGGPGVGPTTVDIQTGNTSVYTNAYIGSKFTITYSHEHPDFAGQTRTVIASASTIHGTNTLTLDSPFNRPTSNTNWPGTLEKYALNADIRATATGNGCIIASAVDDYTKTLGNAAGNPDLAGSTKSANGNISSIGTIANTSIFGGGTSPQLLFKMSVGGARVANSIAFSTTENNFEFCAKYSKTSAANPPSWTALSFRNGTAFNAGEVYFKTTNKNAYTIINETTGQLLGSDDFGLTFTKDGSDNITAISLQASSFITEGTDSIRLIGPVIVTNVLAKSKTLLRGINAQDAKSVPITTDRSTTGNSHIVFPTPNTKPGEKDNLGLVDVYRIVDVYDTGDPNLSANGAILNNNLHRVTSNYTLDSGQTASMYDYASIVLNPGANAPKGQILAVVDRFLHGDSDGAGVFTIDSYHGQVSLDNIPSLISDNGRRYNLKDYLDFRPSRAVETGSTSAANTSYYIPFAQDPNSSHTTGFEIIHPDSLGNFRYDMQFFAPRFDKIVLSVRQKVGGANTGYLRIVSGTDNRSPAIPPLIDPNDMALFTLSLPSYTPNARDINVLEEGNRRWTMKDISKINRRVDRLEYYSSLNLIEQDVVNLKIFDNTGQLERFKHGFIVDNFQTGTALADVGNSITGPNFDFQASIGRGVLRPAYESENISLLYDPEFSTNVRVTQGVLHLPYDTISDDAFLQQIRATSDGAENINPFDVTTWQGTVNLSPAGDVWKSVVDAPMVSVNTSGYHDSLITMANTLNDRMGASMTEWGEWATDWAGIPNLSTSTMMVDPAGEYAHVTQTIPWQPIGEGLIFGTTPNPIAVNTSSSGLDLTALGIGEGLIFGTTPNLINSFGLDIADQLASISFSEDLVFGGIPNQTTIWEDQISTQIRTITNGMTRTGTQYEFDVTSQSSIEIGEFIVNTNIVQFMRPIDIIFKIRGLKPDTTMYPFFDDVDIRQYTERANELVLSGSETYLNPYSSGQADEEILEASSGGRAIIAGFNPTSNTYYVVSANGMFNAAATVTGSMVADSRAIVSYKNYSGSAIAAASTTLTLDDSVWMDSASWWINNNTGAPTTTAANLEKDLYGKTLYITEGRGYGQSRTITHHTDGVATINTPWTITPNTQSRYSISDHKTNLSGDLYGVFHVPNYNWANRLISARKEGDATEDPSTALGVWEHGSSVADERTTDGTRFLTGNKSFSMRDSLIKTDTQSFGIAPFKASGVIETRQKHMQDTFGLTLTPNQITENRDFDAITTTITTAEVGTICWADPLAQTFLVDSRKYPEGLFIDSIDLWFKTKASLLGLSSGEGIPVELQIRPTTGGVPSGGNILTSVIKYPNEINVSTGASSDLPESSNADKYTNFKFNRPVHLTGGTEYAIVLLCADTSYEVWTAKVGSNEVGTGGETGIPAITIDSQPHLGVLFKSQNGSTWQPEVNQDLMFRIHRCKFDTSVIGSAIWKSANAMSHYVPSYTRVQNALAHTNWGAANPKLAGPSSNPYGFKVWDENFTYHRFRVDATKLDYPSGFTGFSYVAAQQGAASVPVVSGLPLDTTDLQLHTDTIPSTSLDILKDNIGSFVLQGTISTGNENISPMINLERMSLTMIKNLINNGELSSNTWPANYITTDTYSSGNVIGGGFYVETTGKGYDGTEAVVITTDTGNIGVGAKGNTVINSVGSIIGVTLQNAGNTYLHSPTITLADTDGTTYSGGGAGASIKYVGEDSAQGPGNFLARYMTRCIVMSPGAEAKDIKLYLTAAQPFGTIIWVYTKVRNKADIEPFNKKNWVLSKRLQPFTAEITSGEDTYREIKFMGGGNDDEFPLSYTAKPDGVSFSGGESPAAERFNTFNEFAIKIVMQSNDPRVVPVVKDLRAIAVE